MRYRGEILILLSTVSWGASYLFVKMALEELGEFNLVALRFTIACAVTALVFRNHTRGIRGKEISHGCRLGALLFVSASLLALGLKSTSISNAGFIIGSMVLFVAIMEAIQTRSKLRPGLAVGVLLALAGLGTLMLRGELSVNPGDLYCLGASVVLAVHVMAAQQAGRCADAVGSSIVQFATTGVLAWGASAFLEKTTVILPGGTVLAAVAVAGVVGTAAAFVCQVTGQKHLSPTRTAFLFTMEPVFATLFAWLFMREPVTWHVYAGGGLLLAGVYVSEYWGGAKPAAPLE